MIIYHQIGDTTPHKANEAGNRLLFTNRHPNFPERFEREAFSTPKQKSKNSNYGLAKNLLIKTSKKQNFNYFYTFSGIDIHDSYSNDTTDKPPHITISTSDLSIKITPEKIKQIKLAAEVLLDFCNNLEMTKTNNAEEQPELLNNYISQEQTISLLNVTSRTLRNYCKRFNIEKHIFGKKIYYLKSDIFKLLRKKN